MKALLSTKPGMWWTVRQWKIFPYMLWIQIPCLNTDNVTARCTQLVPDHKKAVSDLSICTAKPKPAAIYEPQILRQSDHGLRAMAVSKHYRRRNQQVNEIRCWVECKSLQLSAHQRRDTVKEMLQFTAVLAAGNQLPLVALVEYVLNFRGPPGHNRTKATEKNQHVR